MSPPEAQPLLMHRHSGGMSPQFDSGPIKMGQVLGPLRHFRFNKEQTHLESPGIPGEVGLEHKPRYEVLSNNSDFFCSECCGQEQRERGNDRGLRNWAYFVQQILQ